MQSYGSTTRGPTNNTIRVANGAKLAPSSFFFRHANSCLAISNATVTMRAASNIALISDAADSAHTPTSNNVVRLQGRAPLLEVPYGGTVYTRNYMIWQFDLPEEGYTTDRALVTSKGWSSDGTAQFAFTGLERCCENLTEKTTYTLFETIDSTTATPFGATEFARAQAAVPSVVTTAHSKVKCSLVKSGNKILLTLKPDSGMMILVR